MKTTLRNLSRCSIIALLCWASTLPAQSPQAYVVQSVQPTAPAAVGASYSGQPGAGRWYYWVVANFPGGSSGIAGPASATGAANTLDNNNFVTISWSAVYGAVSYDVLATQTPIFPGSCTCLLAAAVAGTTATHTGGALSAYTPAAAPPRATGQFGINVRDYASPRLELVLNGLAVATFDAAGQADEITITEAQISDLAHFSGAWGDLSGVPSTFSPSAHAASHQDGGADELAIAWAQLSGVPDFARRDQNNALTGVQTLNPGTTAQSALILGMANPTEAGQRDGHFVQLRGAAHDGMSPHWLDIFVQADITDNSASGRLRFWSRQDDGSLTTIGWLTHDGVFNAISGYQIAGAALNYSHLAGSLPAHAASHGDGGGDEVTITESQISDLAHFNPAANSRTWGDGAAAEVVHEFDVDGTNPRIIARDNEIEIEAGSVKLGSAGEPTLFTFEEQPSDPAAVPGSGQAQWYAKSDGFYARRFGGGASRLVEAPELSDSAGLRALLSDETGTGPAVFGTAPALTTPSLASYIVAELPPAGTVDRLAVVTDAATAGDCITGGGSDLALCRDDGVAWGAVGDGGSGGGGTTWEVLEFASPSGSGVGTAEPTIAGCFRASGLTQTSGQFTLEFDNEDTVDDEYLHCNKLTPSYMNAGIDPKIYMAWGGPISAMGGIRVQVKIGCYVSSSDSWREPEWGAVTEVTCSNSTNTANVPQICSATLNRTGANWTAATMCGVRIDRDTEHVEDDLGGVAKLFGFHLEIPK